MSFERAFFEKAKSKLGRPYIWAGKGDWAVRGGLVVPMSSLGCDWGCDCSGLLTTTVRELGGEDLRGAWGSKRMFEALPEPAPDEELLVCCYPNHVALGLGGTTFTLEAAGGDQTTLDAKTAQAAGARVQFGYATHSNLLGVRSLRALMAAHP